MAHIMASPLSRSCDAAADAKTLECAQNADLVSFHQANYAIVLPKGDNVPCCKDHRLLWLSPLKWGWIKAACPRRLLPTPCLLDS